MTVYILANGVYFRIFSLIVEIVSIQTLREIYSPQSVKLPS